jgi:hypothetical protein
MHTHKCTQAHTSTHTDTHIHTDAHKYTPKPSHPSGLQWSTARPVHPTPCAAASLQGPGPATSIKHHATLISLTAIPRRISGSLSTSEVKRRRARSVLGWGTAWEDLRVLSAFASVCPVGPLQTCRRMRKQLQTCIPMLGSALLLCSSLPPSLAGKLLHWCLCKAKCFYLCLCKEKCLHL